MENKINHYLNNNYKCNKKNQDTFNNIKRIIVIGDLHGDYNILIKCLKLAKLINNKLEWIGGNTHVVQLGDILDAGGRGVEFESEPYEEFKIYEYLNYLNNQANLKGGYVHYLIGNHELMNLIGDFNYVHPTHLIKNRRELFRPGSYITQMLACHSYGVLKINGWIFCHAGLLPQHLENNTITSLNKLVKNILLGKKNIQNLSQSEELLIFSKDSLFWNREYVYNQNKCNILNTTLNNIKDSRGMVIGHTPHENITGNCNNQLWYADIGLSQAFGNNNFNNIQVLEILNNKPRVLR
jgi:hypothetical protein